MYEAAKIFRKFYFPEQNITLRFGEKRNVGQKIVWDYAGSASS
jgi:hypothetical protein